MEALEKNKTPFAKQTTASYYCVTTGEK